MATVVVDIEEESLDKLIVDDLKAQYEGNKSRISCDKKLLKSFKRVIEYYGGKLDE